MKRVSYFASRFTLHAVPSDELCILFWRIYAIAGVFDFADQDWKAVFERPQLLKFFDFLQRRLWQSSNFQQKFPAISIDTNVP